MALDLPIIDLGRLPYRAAYDLQLQHVDKVIAARASCPIPGYLLLVEHDPVITVSRRAGAGNHLLATPALLAQHGIAVEETDRGGDITYHGPGQLVIYPILDLNLLNLGLHDYMRLLEQAVMETCAHNSVTTHRDPKATGVWTNREPSAKIAAMGVRVRRWVSMHGLALNVTTDLSHFSMIVPCGLQRPVTSLREMLGDACPPLSEVKINLTGHLCNLIAAALAKAEQKRAAAALATPSIP